MENTNIEFTYALAWTADGQTCFAASGTGLKRAVDGGASWQDAYIALDLQESLPTTSVAVAQSAGASTVIAGVPGGVLVSTDTGETWTAVSVASPLPAVSCVALSPNFAEDGVAIAGTTQDGVFRSTSGGRGWDRWNFGLLDMHVYCLAISPDFAEDEVLFIGVESGMFRSTNGGRAWREVDLPFGYDAVWSLAVSHKFKQDGALYAGTETQGLWKSTDGGKTWQQVGADRLNGPVNAVLLDADDNVLVLLDENLLLSRDAGATWLPVDMADGVSAVTAPQGLGVGAGILVGLINGEVVPLTL